MALGTAEAMAFGLPALPIAVIQHPLGGLKAEDVQKRAASVVDTIQNLLTTSRQQLLHRAGADAEQC